MGKRRDISQGKLASGLLGVGLASGLVVASLGVVGPAGASCVNFSGIAIGGGGPDGHCQASFGSFSIVIGPTPADEDGSDAFAGNPEQFSPFNFAISVGGTAEQPTFTSAGRIPAPDLPSLGNVSFATAGSTANTAGVVNLAASFGGTRSSLLSAGVGNSTLNLGSDNELVSAGTVNNSTVLFGNENTVSASNTGTGLGVFLTGFNVAFSTLGNNNTVVSGASVPPVLGGPGNGPLSIAGAIGVNDQTGADTVRNTNFGIELRTPFTVQEPTSVLAAGGTQRSLVRPSLNFSPFAAGGTQRSLVRPSLNFSPGQNAASNPGKAVSAGGSVLESVSDRITTSAKKVRDTVNSVTAGRAGDADADAASNSNSDE